MHTTEPALGTDLFAPAAAAPRGAPGGLPRRVALYSHDTMGVGHMRRNALIARVLAAADPPPALLLVAGAREAGALPLPPGADCVTLPAYHKCPCGGYRPRSLATGVGELTALRARTAAAALDAFAPDVLVVDKVPRGALGELGPALAALRARGTRCVLGLRDVLDDAATVRREWDEGGFAEAVDDYYDAVWVYGDPAVCDQAREYGYPDSVAAKIRYTGYLARPPRPAAEGGPTAQLPDLPPGTRLMLCMVGGGQDGVEAAAAFAAADFPADVWGVVVTGPYMPPEDRARLARLADRPRTRVLTYVADPEPLLARADRVVAMGGYNTVCELLGMGKRALILPRVAPRREQLIRAERMARLGLLDMLPPGGQTPEGVAAWLRSDAPPPARVGIDLGGACRLPCLLEELQSPPALARRGCYNGRSAWYAIP
jgi:predicted glycosyltransferase